MSAVRTSQKRASERRNRSAPYGRSILSTIGRYLGGVIFGQEPESQPARKSPSPPSLSGSETIVEQQPEQELPEVKPVPQPMQLDNSPTIYPMSPPPQIRPPLTPVRGNLPALLSNPGGNNISGVANILSQSTGRAVTTAEAEGIIAMLRGNSPPTTHQSDRFRFSVTPTRESSPSGTAGATPGGSTPRKTLSRNPNGSYRWQGAGSAKQARRKNRYGSPAFGVSPSKPNRDNHLTESEGKRRRLTEDLSSPGLADASRRTQSPDESRSLPFPIITTPTRGANGIANKPPAPVLSPSRLRTPAKPTAPVVPSPLRQAWSDASSSSSQERQSPSQSSKQTKTANFMAELIKESTPPKKPDLSNPYQTASPVGKVGPPRRSMRRTRATGRPESLPKGEEKQREEKTKDSPKDVSPLAIIKATVPKGSKRSRPPPNLSASTSTSQSIAEEVERDAEDHRSSKKVKPSLIGLGAAPDASRETLSITIEEVDVVMEEPQRKVPPSQTSLAVTSTISPSSRSAFTGAKTSSVPKEPSKLRFSIQPEATSAPPSPAPAPAPAPQTKASPPTPFAPPLTPFTFAVPAPVAPAQETTPSKSEFKFTLPKTEFKLPPPPSFMSQAPAVQSTPEPSAKKPLTVEEAKRQATQVDVSRLPAFNFVSPPSTSAVSNHIEARDKAQTISSFGLPKFAFDAQASASTSKATSSNSKASTSAPQAFNWAAAGLKPQEPKKDVWTCSLCAISNPLTASKCQACETPNPASEAPKEAEKKPLAPPAPPAASSGGFNWAAAGLKPQEPKNDVWTCSLCAISNPLTASKCQACETPNPSSEAPKESEKKPLVLPAPPTASTGGFNWAAAGLKPPTTSGWNCSLCGLSNNASAQQCTTCENPR